MNPVIKPLIEIQQQLQIYHWQTESYAEHKALGNIYDAFGELVDTYIETLFGRAGRLFAGNGFTIKLNNYDQGSLNTFVDETLNFLTNDLPVEIKGEPATDLANIRDDMVGLFNKLKYLLTLK